MSSGRAIAVFYRVRTVLEAECLRVQEGMFVVTALRASFQLPTMEVIGQREFDVSSSFCQTTPTRANYGAI
jgi:hypothetical protein